MKALLAAMLASGAARADIANPASFDRLQEETRLKVRDKIEPLLEKYCGTFCQLIQVKIDIEEEIPVSDDIGFESAVGQTVRSELFVRKVTAEIQIDSRINALNQERLDKILQIHLRTFGIESQVIWQNVALPQIKAGEVEAAMPQIVGGGFGSHPEVAPEIELPPRPYTPAQEQSLRLQLEGQLMKALGSVVERYCPNQCIIENIQIDGQMIPLRDSRTFPKSQIVSGNAGDWVLRLDNVDIDVTIDDKIEESARDQIINMMRTRTKNVSPLNLNVSLTAFPETYAQKTKRIEKESEDPYGLERLRQMLTLFKELAGTKEIITTNTSSNRSETEVRENSVARTDSTTSNSSNVNSTTRATTDSRSRDFSNNVESSATGLSNEEIAAYAAGIILLLTLMAIVIMKFSRANRDAREMLMVPGFGAKAGAAGAGIGDEWAVASAASEEQGGFQEGKPNAVGSQLALAVKVKELKDELVDLFTKNPKVAKDTFSRFLKEDGVEETSKYVHVFGYMVIFPLLDDPNFQRELYELSEYYHNANFHFSLSEEHNLLLRLKTRCTASEIRVLTRRDSEKFDFLQKLDPSQIYNLILDENVQVQSIVLAQLDPKRRRAVFEMYQGAMKVKLMSQLSTAETIPKEYMVNVAKALAKKVNSRPEYDTENIRSSDVLLDLLEKASLTEQRTLMATLQKQNADTARSLKMKLVTVEIMPFLKDGHLLELILGMERRDLLIFLTGTAEHIRDLLLRKAPEELSDSWIEDMNAIGGIDEQSFRMVELRVLNRIRNLANNGVISLLDINSMIFDRAGDGQVFQQEEPGMQMKNLHAAA